MYILKANGLTLPVQGMLGEEQVINRALNLLTDFGDLLIYRETSNGRFEVLRSFLSKKESRRKVHYSKPLSYKRELAG